MIRQDAELDFVGAGNGYSLAWNLQKWSASTPGTITTLTSSASGSTDGPGMGLGVIAAQRRAHNRRAEPRYAYGSCARYFMQGRGAAHRGASCRIRRHAYQTHPPPLPGLLTDR